MRVTSAPAHVSWRAAETEAVVVAAYAVGALMLAGVAAVHVQQYVSLFHGVRWIGALFLATAVASVAAVIGLAFRRVRQLAALAGVVISVGALAGLVVSYGQGLFGWQEAGFRTPVELAVITEFGAVIALSIALAASTGTSAANARRGTQ
jgi:ABC-type multidrug transport system permease subunit